MRFYKIFVFICIFILSFSMTGAKYRLGLDAGYDNGPGFSISGSLKNFLPGSRMELRAAVGMSFPDPGNAYLARKIFINDATNGVPETSGKNYNFRIDITLPLKTKLFPNPRYYFGIRYSRFTGRFKYIGGNEDFNITSDPWGVGGGVETYFPMNRKLNFHIIAGLDYFPSSHLHGHDTTYYPDNQNVNGRKNYTYYDADRAIKQPRLEFRLMAGISTRR